MQADLLPGWQMQNGHHMAGLRLQLAPIVEDLLAQPRRGWDSAVVQLVGVGECQIGARSHWPSPAVFHTNGMQTIGYHDGVVLPLEVVPLDASKPVELRAGVDLGVCNQICMPAAVQVSAVLDTGAPDALINAALKAQPVGGKRGGFARDFL